MIRRLKIASGLLVGVCGIFLLGLWARDSHVDRRFIFHPRKELGANPARWGLPFQQVIFPSTDGVQLYGWFIPFPGAGVTILWFHGNGGNISYRLRNIVLLHDHLHANIFLFDYRGYGRSRGEVSEKGTYRDARGALDYLLSRPDVYPSRIVYFGHSLGTAVAVQLALTHPPAALILESPFTSIDDLARRSFFFSLLTPLLETHYDTARRISDIHVPLLIIQGDRDRIVPPFMARRLYDLAPGPKEFYLVAGAGHNNTYRVGGDEYFQTLSRFLSSVWEKRDLSRAGR